MSCSNFRKEGEAILADVQKIQERVKGRGYNWNKFRGDAVERVVVHYLQKHLPENVKLVRSSWVDGCATEFDLLIIKKNTSPIRFTNAYPKDAVILTVEIKAAGLYYRLDDIEKELKEKLSKIIKNTGKPWMYLSIWENEKRAEKTFNSLGNERTFILRVGKKEKEGEWERFVSTVNKIIEDIFRS